MKIINKILSIINLVTDYFKTKNKPTYNHYLLSCGLNNTCIPIGNIKNLEKDILGLTILLRGFYKRLDQKHVRKQELYLFKEVKKLDELKYNETDCSILVRYKKSNTIHLYCLHQIDTITNNNKIYIKHKKKILLVEFDKIWKLLFIDRKYKYEE